MMDRDVVNYSAVIALLPLLCSYAPAPRAGALSDVGVWRLTSVCLSCTSGLSREQRGLGRLKLEPREPTSHVTWTPFSRPNGQRSTCMGRGHIVAASRTACLPLIMCKAKHKNINKTS